MVTPGAICNNNKHLIKQQQQQKKKKNYAHIFKYTVRLENKQSKMKTAITLLVFLWSKINAREDNDVMDEKFELETLTTA
jgi:hypothetical protein